MKATTFNPHSSFIAEARYTEENQTLRLQIHGYWYYYIGVTKQKVGRFKNASSRGTYFAKYIKGQYKVIRRRVRNV